MRRIEHLNLQVIEPSRKAPKAGDLFALRPEGRPYYFGRVIRTDADVHGLFPAILIYIYSATSAHLDQIPVVRRDQLLVAPLMTNRLPWTRGYFKTIKNIPLTPWDAFKLHSFRSFTDHKLYDECGRQVHKPTEAPVGDLGLHSYKTIDDAVSDALGIPRAPD